MFCFFSSDAGQLPCFLSTFGSLDVPSVFLNKFIRQEVSHAPADVGWVLRTRFCNSGAGHGERHHESVSPSVAIHQVQENAVLCGDIDLRNVACHAWGWAR